jgi:tetratricopeptide (TPR) repeat protein
METHSFNRDVAELAKEKVCLSPLYPSIFASLISPTPQGNVVFKAKDYVTARSLYSHAMAFDQSNHLYPLNRSMANLKLARYAYDCIWFLCRLIFFSLSLRWESWDEAEADTTKVLDLSPGNLKALFRRGVARKELGKWGQARKGKSPTTSFKSLHRF